jgi:hypothetical protein
MNASLASSRPRASRSTLVCDAPAS